MTEKTTIPYPVVLHPHHVLNQRAETVTAVDDTIREILARMQATMYAADGIGLAANQVNVLKRLVVIDVGTEQPDGKRDYRQKNPMALVNPHIEWASDERIIWQEGCLSLPGLYADVERAARVRMSYLDANGDKQQLEANGLLSVCIQHEIDHLDGILFPQRMSKLRRNMVENRYIKKKREFLDDPSYLALDGDALITPSAQK